MKNGDLNELFVDWMICGVNEWVDPKTLLMKIRKKKYDTVEKQSNTFHDNLKQSLTF